MTEMMTAKGIQELLQIDRSTVYRMADAGQLPAIKVGKQWRFPADQIDNWFQANIMNPVSAAAKPEVGRIAPTPSTPLQELLPLDWLKMTLDTFAELLGVMLVVTDMTGHPIIQPSNPGKLFALVSSQPSFMSKIARSWRELASTMDLVPKFSASPLGLLNARSMIGVGTALKGMVIAGCIAPPEWPPAHSVLEALVVEHGAERSGIEQAINDVFMLDVEQQAAVLAALPSIATIVAHTIHERTSLLQKLQSIAELAQPFGKQPSTIKSQ